MTSSGCPLVVPATSTRIIRSIALAMKNSAKKLNAAPGEDFVSDASLIEVGRLAHYSCGAHYRENPYFLSSSPRGCSAND